MRAFAVLASLAFLLAGCSGGGGGDGGAASVASTSGTSTAPPPPPVPRTDTLHFLLAPAVTTLAPTGSDERSPVLPGFRGGPGGGQEETGAEWAYQVTTPTNVSAGEVHVWVEVKEQMFDAPNNPFDDSCTWELTTAIGADTEEIEGCLNEPPGPIAPGVRELVFTLVLETPIELEANETITVTLERNAFSLSTNNAVDALSGSAEHDSRIQLRGLKEPVGS